MDSIVVVEDEPQILELLTDILEMYGYRVLPFPNADLAWRYFQDRREAPQLLITDLNMPGMNGIEFIKEVRKLPGYKFMPILFLTTESQQSKKLEAKAAGASGWLVKPASADELLNTIKLVLR